MTDFNYNYILVNIANIDVKKIALILTKKLGYYYLNTEELIDYKLFDKDKMAEVCGLDYMDKEQKKVIKSINSYEKTIISMNYETFSSNIQNIEQKSQVIYLEFSKKQLQEEYDRLKKVVDSQKTVSAKKSVALSNLSMGILVFEERDKFLKKNCKIAVKCDISNIDETVNSILTKIKG